MVSHYIVENFAADKLAIWPRFPNIGTSLAEEEPSGVS